MRKLKQTLSKSRQMKVSRGIETSIEEGVKEMVFDRYKYRGGVEEQPIRYKNRSSIDPLVVEQAEAFSIDPPSIKKLSRLRYEKA